MSETNTTKFTVIYDGEDHANHEINIMLLGKSLTALGDILYKTNEIINEDKDSIDVKVDADFIEGSFGFTVELIQSASDAKDILSLIGFGAPLLAGAGSVAGVISWLKGEEINFIDSDNDDIQVIKAGTRTIECSSDIAKLVENIDIRRSLDRMIKEPMEHEGTHSILINTTPDNDSNAFIVDKPASKSFIKLAVEQTTTFDEQNISVMFIAADIQSKSGWKIKLHGEDKIAKMEDDGFRNRLLNKEEPHVFGKSFNVKLKTITKKSYGAEKKSYIIKRINHES